MIGMNFTEILMIGRDPNRTLWLLIEHIRSQLNPNSNKVENGKETNQTYRKRIQ